MGGSYEFLDGAERLFDARSTVLYYATGITPAMSEAQPGTGKGYDVLLRLYGPLEPWFNKARRRGDFELQK